MPKLENWDEEIRYPRNREVTGDTPIAFVPSGRDAYSR